MRAQLVFFVGRRKLVAGDAELGGLGRLDRRMRTEIADHAHEGPDQQEKSARQDARRGPQEVPEAAKTVIIHDRGPGVLFMKILVSKSI